MSSPFFSFTGAQGEHINIAYDHVVQIMSGPPNLSTDLYYITMTSGIIHEVSKDTYLCFLSAANRRNRRDATPLHNH